MSESRRDVTGYRRPRSSARKVGRDGLRLYTAYAQSAALPATLVIVTGLGTAWGVSYLWGGSRTPGPHLFYLPLVLAAVRFGWPGALVVASTSGVFAGPLLPADVAADTAQPAGAWVVRLVIFTGIGGFVAWLTQAPDQTLRRRLQSSLVSARLRRAVQGGAIEVLYQPIRRLDDGHVVAVEALARWRDPTGHYISPADFIPAAEHTGAIVDLDLHVLRRAATMAQHWGTAVRPVAISVNLSTKTLARADIAATVARVLTEVGLPASLLQLEITESAIIEDCAAAVRRLESLRALGVAVAVDDFGSGHASLDYLKSLPIDVVKLDRGMLCDATVHARARRLLEGVTHLCQLLDLKVVAEGIERPEECSLLRSLGVQTGQGFLLGRPAPPDEVPDALRTPTLH